MPHHSLIRISIAALMTQMASAFVAVDLRCDGRVNPLGASSTPQLSWRVETKERNASPTAWQVLVAGSPEALRADRGDLWDSGRIPAGRMAQLTYAGRSLAAGQRCHWKVRVWSADGNAESWSDPAVWELAPQSPADWRGARWIGDGRPLPETDEKFYEPDPAPLMRREFKLEKPVVRARLHVAGLGWHVPSLNGNRVGDHVLDPPWTIFDKRTFFSTHDVTAQVTEGDNCLGLTLGNGWYNPLPLRMWGRRNIREALPVGRPRAIACLVIDHPDGTQTSVVTGPDWTCAQGPVISNSVYLGEVYDARMERNAWNKPGYDASDWRPVKEDGASLAPLQTLAMPPVRAAAPIPAVAVTKPKDGVFIVDFGRNFTGVPESVLRAPAGTRITFRYGEILHPDGSLNPLTSVCGQIKGMRKAADGSEVPSGGPGAPAIAWQQDVYIAKEGGEQRYRPEFTFHGFRYMEISGLEETPLVGDFQGIPLHTDLASAGSFSCSNDRLNRIQEMCRRTFLSNVVSVQSDCPHRERFGYGGDIVATSETLMMNFDMSGFYAKTVRDWADSALPDGNFTDTAPSVGIQYCGVGWAMVHPLLIEQLYQHYGNRELLVEQLPAAIRWLELEASARKNGLVIKGLGDHEALAKIGGPVLTTPMFVDSARRIARLARVAGRDADASRFDAMADESAAAWAAGFLDPATGRVGEGTQSGQSLALGFGVAPAPAREAVFGQLVRMVEEAEGPSLTTGIFGTRFLLEELSRHKRSDLAYGLANKQTFPSWGWMLENDATTLWEHWAGSDGTFSHNHPMFGSVSGWFFRWLGGIQAADDAVGFDRMVICPQVVDGLDWVKCSHRTIRGMIESNWSNAPTGRRFEIVIPAGATALVKLPVRPGDVVAEGASPAEGITGGEVLDSEPGNFQIRVGGGRYEFTVGPKPKP